LAIARIWRHLRLTRRLLYECRLEVQMLLDREVSPRHAHAVAAISLATSI
jgi:hypothetical protein